MAAIESGILCAAGGGHRRCFDLAGNLLGHSRARRNDRCGVKCLERSAHLPSVDKLLAQASSLIELHGRSLTTDAIRSVLDEDRSSIRAGGAPPDPSELLPRISDRLQEWTQSRPRSVINATGVIIHTNLGRAPLSQAAIAAMTAAASGYSDLEYDLERGERGHRMAAVEDSLKRVTGPRPPSSSTTTRARRRWR